MKPASSLTRNRQVAAISSTLPCRPSGTPAAFGRRTLIPLWIVSSRIDAARRNDVNADVMGSEFRGEPARHADQPHLRRRQVSAATAASGNRAVADEEQNAPVAIPDHWLDQRARQVERAVKNHTPDQLPIRIDRFSERLVRPDPSI